MTYKNLDKKICQWCGVEFQPNRPEQECCSYSCASKLRWSDPTYKGKVVTKMTYTIRQLYAEGKFVNPRKGKKNSPEHIGKCRTAMKGRIPWNKGIPRTKEVKEALSKALKGRRAPQDVSKTSETMKRVAKEQNFGKHFEDMTDEAKTRRAKNISKAAREQNFARHFLSGKRPTKPERIVRDLLICLHISAISEYDFKDYRLDFALPENKLAILVDGCFWHCCPIHFPMAATRQQQHCLIQDRKRDAALHKAGWRVLHIWEHEVNEPATLECLRKEVMLAHENSVD